MAWPSDIVAMLNGRSPAEFGYARSEYYGPQGDIETTPTRAELQRFVCRALERPVVDAGVSLDYAWTGQGEMFP